MTRRWRLAVWTMSFGLAAGGCTSDQLNPFSKGDAPPAVGQHSVVLRPDGLAEATPSPADGDQDLLAAKEVFRRGDYAKAEPLFHTIAENGGSGNWWKFDFFGPAEPEDKDKDKNKPKKERSVVVAEEARFYEAECLYMQQYYPKAADTYRRMLNDFGSGAHREQACQRLFDIANYWLEDTRTEMEQTREKQAGKRWFVPPHFMHVDKTKPFLDEEGRAIEALETVRYCDINGPLADKALFMMGTVKFFNEDYREADYQFTQIVEKHKNSPLYPRAAEMAIISKAMSTGGSDYDGRKVAEARDMVPIALASYQSMEQKDPQLAREKEEFLRRQLAGITMQQAEKDYKTAEFYLRTSRPESAFFLFEIVRRRYPGTKYADMATDQMHQIRTKVEKENGTKLPMPEAAPLQPDAVQYYQQAPGAPQMPAPQPAAPQGQGPAPGAFGQPRTLPPTMQR
jgi:outer membrane protein assembly factor BamD (BamD/ComL family)